MEISRLFAVDERELPFSGARVRREVVGRARPEPFRRLPNGTPDGHQRPRLEVDRPLRRSRPPHGGRAQGHQARPRRLLARGPVRAALVREGLRVRRRGPRHGGVDRRGRDGAPRRGLSERGDHELFEARRRRERRRQLRRARVERDARRGRSQGADHARRRRADEHGVLVRREAAPRLGDDVPRPAGGVDGEPARVHARVGSRRRAVSVSDSARELRVRVRRGRQPDADLGPPGSGVVAGVVQAEHAAASVRRPVSAEARRLRGQRRLVSPYDAENGDTTGQRTQPSPHVSFAKRVSWQTYAYDAVGNTTSSNDDAAGFYDRSLGTITNGGSSAGPYQLKAAAQASGTRAGELTAAYDDTGNLVSMAVRRDGPCLPTGALCSQRYAYEWDEVGQLSRARRWDLSTAGLATDPLPSGAAAAELRYAYAGSERVLKTAVDSSANELHTVYVFSSLELRRAQFIGDDYERTAATEVPYLLGPGVRARVYYATNDVPTLSSGQRHVLFELPDHLGSASFVVDKDTSELVEATRYEAYGSVESDYRPERWASYRSDHRFTRKEDDIEVGLAYFGSRYYSPALNRWISADPLAVHEPGRPI